MIMNRIFSTYPVVKTESIHNGYKLVYGGKIHTQWVYLIYEGTYPVGIINGYMKVLSQPIPAMGLNIVQTDTVITLMVVFVDIHYLHYSKLLVINST